MSFMRKIRNNRQAVRIPMILLVVALTVGLVAAFAQWSVPNTTAGSNVQNPQGDADAGITGKINEIRRFEQVLKSNPDNLQVLKDLANTQYDVAIEYYFVLQDYENGSRYMELAINSYQKVLQAEPDNIYVRTDMATLAYYVGNNELAKENFEKAIAQDPTFINARNNYGEFLLNSLGDTEGAIAQWQAILEMNPDPGTKSSIEAKINKAQSAAKQ